MALNSQFSAIVAREGNGVPISHKILEFLGIHHTLLLDNGRVKCSRGIPFGCFSILMTLLEALLFLEHLLNRVVFKLSYTKQERACRM